jgi:plasmid stability protein
MLVNITIRNIPLHVRDELARRARLRGQSQQEFLTEVLTGLTERPDRAELLRRIDERRARLPQIDVTEFLSRDAS